MRKTPMVALGLTASLALAGATAAVGQITPPGHTLAVGVSPSKAGTSRKPKTVKVKLDISNAPGSGTTASEIEIFFPKTVKLNARGFPTCSVDTLENDGPSACPRGSNIGSGTAGALVNPTSPAPTPLAFKATFYVGSSKQFNIVLKPIGSDVNRVLVGAFGAGGGTFGQKLTIAIPEDLQQPAPGVYSALTDIEISLNATTGTGRRKHGIFQTTGCSSRRHRFRSRLTYVNNPNPPAARTTRATDDVACRR